jgi:hypothetical protein
MNIVNGYKAELIDQSELTDQEIIDLDLSYCAIFWRTENGDVDGDDQILRMEDPIFDGGSSWCWSGGSVYHIGSDQILVCNVNFDSSNEIPESVLELNHVKDIKEKLYFIERQALTVYDDLQSVKNLADNNADCIGIKDGVLSFDNTWTTGFDLDQYEFKAPEDVLKLLQSAYEVFTA